MKFSEFVILKESMSGLLQDKMKAFKVFIDDLDEISKSEDLAVYKSGRTDTLCDINREVYSTEDMSVNDAVKIFSADKLSIVIYWKEINYDENDNRNFFIRTHQIFLVEFKKVEKQFIFDKLTIDLGVDPYSLLASMKNKNANGEFARSIGKLAFSTNKGVVFNNNVNAFNTWKKEIKSSSDIFDINSLINKLRNEKFDVTDINNTLVASRYGL